MDEQTQTQDPLIERMKAGVIELEKLSNEHTWIQLFITAHHGTVREFWHLSIGGKTFPSKKTLDEAINAARSRISNRGALLQEEIKEAQARIAALEAEFDKLAKWGA